ncbi:MAG: Asp-tRNA(Asn)/Glu-tRNA(Gln) amidotransferase subunit GatC [Acetobacteraceae bacterium]|nr:Asp-tRNA(Asn)/Glu-tRNA(Gln) amidotransferase subunit GatC [Acetobacteraceae bacterium]MCX7684619.1 Asp-tRNA(Asn)/Glu-tRNA(Gln) amidotransferase subunit GatC [Acetobacteraceae bacterium]MDW8399336.1 Asp-tRNA(Asn)/Glu-tRNA(Gln) amidotransferase subunit GatC [Acetobacteraceae bacterium]
MSLDQATVRRVAALARIRLSDADLPRVQGELNAILGWIEQLQAVDTEGVEPMAGGAPEGAAPMPMREDVVTEGGIADLILANAPDREGDYFAVPKVVE